ncbi:glycoside hydrolase family 19 protein [Pseudomonas nitroreducens]|uniref:glycoside hydrolase family 19 protein n=1 Tax=Pseudomonas nitroreducens TaxID=46680 RepID=UPI0026598099|nr:glycoside hydrolase family 19 protein [Pseudomonas nitroreducens]MCP1651705.1 putative chitinase [Pseudomonas nitroreducens]MCP1684430.1 putative chitinase [Pseudomonas nitroreducens]
MPLTEAQLTAILPSAGNKVGVFVPSLNRAMQRYKIDSAVRQAAFLAQIGHESGQLRYVREIWGPTPAQQKYEGRGDLGNTEPGDGKRFMGRGLIQITGRDNYRKVAAALGIPLLSSPELLEQPEWAVTSAAWWWADRGLNEIADSGDFEKLTRRINGGLNGLDDRKAIWERAKSVLGAA